MYPAQHETNNMFSVKQNSYNSRCEAGSYFSGSINPNTQENYFSQSSGQYFTQNEHSNSAGHSNYVSPEISQYYTNINNANQFLSQPQEYSSVPAYNDSSILKSEETVSQTFTTQPHPAYFGGEPMTLYGSGGEPVTLYANNAGVVSQSCHLQQKPVQLSETRKSTLAPPPRMTKTFLQQRAKQVQPKQVQLAQITPKPHLLNIQTQPQLPHQQPSQSFNENNLTGLKMKNMLPTSGEVQKVKILNPGQRFYPLDNIKSQENYNISLNFDEYGNHVVLLTGSKKKFIQHIHQAVLNFMRDHKIPVKSFCRNVLNKEEVILKLLFHIIH